MIRPRLMHVIRGLGTGGTEMMCLRLARHWQPSFEQSIVAWAPSPRTLESDFRCVPHSALAFAPADRDDMGRWNWLRTMIRDFSPDAVLIHIFGRPHLLAASAARSAGIRAMAASAGNPPPHAPRDRRRWRSVLIASRLLNCPVIACSHAVGRELNALTFGVAAPGLVIPYGIDGKQIAAGAATARHKRTNRAPVIGMVARLNRIKDHDTLLRAFSFVCDELPDAELWIAGDGPLLGHLQDEATRLGISRRTRFLGERTDIPSLLGQMDVYAFSTTRDEGFGIALIEAMSAGVPIVASDVPACREVLGAGAAGVLLPPGDARAMARALAELIGDGTRRAALIDSASERVGNEYTIEVCAARWEELLFQTKFSRAATEIQCAS